MRYNYRVKWIFIVTSFDTNKRHASKKIGDLILLKYENIWCCWQVEKKLMVFNKLEAIGCQQAKKLKTKIDNYLSKKKDIGLK